MQALDTVDEGTHRLAAGRQHRDHPAIEGRYDRLHLAARRLEAKLDHVLAALVEIGVREFEEGREYIGRGDPLGRQVAVRVELRGDGHIGTDDAADARQQVAFAIVIALRHHGAVQSEHHRIHRQRRAKLC